MLLLSPGELYRLLGASSVVSYQKELLDSKIQVLLNLYSDEVKFRPIRKKTDRIITFPFN
jgi:hypothetical protein